MRAWVAGILIGALGVGCAADGPTGLVLAVRSDLSIPDEMNEILVQARDARGAKLFENRFPLQGPGSVSLPGKLGLQTGEGLSGAIEIDVIGRRGTRPAVLKAMRIDLPAGSVREVAVELNRDCLGVLCPQSLTCVAGRCETATFPHAPTPEGPPCNCFSLFPACVGARWAYDELREGVKVEQFKQWSFATYTQIGDPRHGKQSTKAFLQVRPSALDFSHKWISSREKPHRVLFWEKEDQFTRDLVPRLTTFFVPAKVRLNEGLDAAAGNPQEERYQQFDSLPDGVEVRIDCLDLWNVISLDEVKTLPKSNFPDRYARANVVCHRRVGTVLGVHPPEMGDMYKESDKIFCFVRGVGKVYERSFKPAASEEVLVDFNNPGRCALPE